MTYGSSTSTTNNTSTGDNNIDALIADRRWTSPNVTFSFTSSFSNDYEDEDGYPNQNVHSASFSVLNSTQRAVTREWVKMYNDVSGLNLTELTGTRDRDATIRMAESSDPGTAYAYLPWNDGRNSVHDGDIWFNKNDYDAPAIGNYASYTIGHELGHALGLEHGHENNGIRDVAMNFNRDSMEFSIMTYRSYIGAPDDGVYNETNGYAQSLMMYDIRAIQQMYGANFGHNSGATTYGFSTTTGEMFVNGVSQGRPAGNRIFRTIWDGNGIDTYDFSNYTTRLNIDLAPGGWSDLDVGGNSQRARLNSGGSEYARGHVFNALQFNGDRRSLIENARGGSGDDSLHGNAANNQLYGNAGRDSLFGLAGNDQLYGGAGNDDLYGGLDNDILDGGSGSDRMFGYSGNDVYYVDSSGDVVTEYANNGTDLVNSAISYELGAHLENLTLIGTATSGRGNSFNNTINGNSVNNDLRGGFGDDRVYGHNGNDRLYGEFGNDLIFGGQGDDSAYGGYGNDFINGEAGNDTLFGDQGQDTLLGFEGSDILSGGADNDVLHGYGRNPFEVDRMIGGTGADRFILGESKTSDFAWLYGVGEFYKGTTYISASAARSSGPSIHLTLNNQFVDSNLINSTDLRFQLTALDGYAIIEDFKQSEGDKLQIFGSASQYSIHQENLVGSTAMDTVIRFTGSLDKLAILQDTTLFSAATDFISVA